jgi:hypothetical protein
MAMVTPLQLDRDAFRILLYRDDAREILVASGREGLLLPVVAIPRQTRIAQELTAALRTSWHVEAYCVFTLPAREGASYAVLEASLCEAPPPGMHWQSALSPSVDSFENHADYTAIQDSLAALDGYRREERAAAFGKSGWMSELVRWIAAAARRIGLTLTGPFRQLNASPTFSLLRFETDGPAIWFKAVGAPNEREYDITLALVSLFPRFLPEVLATRPECRGWLMREVEGPLLQECVGWPSWETAVTDLADLQARSFPHVPHLLDLGCRDLHAQKLERLVEPFFQTAGELMERQTKLSPAALSREELRKLSVQVQSGLQVLSDSGIAATLGHLDINPRNIVSSPRGCVFLDWAEAFVGHPFLTFAYLLEHFRRAFGAEHAREAQLITCYSSFWRTIASEEAIRRALDVAPLAAVFAYATASGAWKRPEEIRDSRVASYLRSLTRRMEREARLLQQRSVPCPS